MLPINIPIVTGWNTVQVTKAEIPLAHYLELNQNVRKLEAIDPTLIVAGGCLRDWTFKKEVNDIDIFMNVKPGPASLFNRALERVGFKITKQMFGDNIPLDYKLNPNIRCVYNIEPAGHSELEYQIILMQPHKTTFGLVEMFPIDICQLWWKPGYDRIVATKEFSEAYYSGVSKKCNELYADGHKYLDKIKKKYENMFLFEY